MNISVRVEGDALIVRRLDGRLPERPLRRFMARAAFIVEGYAKVNASKNIDTGAGVNSIQSVVESASRATVGTNMEHMFYLHEGTRPHFPPIAAVTPWAKRHGIDPFLVALGISRHGTKANPFLKNALNQADGPIRAQLPQLAHDIVAEMTG